MALAQSAAQTYPPIVHPPLSRHLGYLNKNITFLYSVDKAKVQLIAEKCCVDNILSLEK